MSYLDLPRLHFFGTFRADPSTLNNSARNYRLKPPLTPAWNPDGSHAWQFPGCTVQTALLTGGASADDPLVGAPIASTDKPSTAKLVDLDTEQQIVSMIFGLQVQVGNSASGTVTGSFTPTAFNDLFGRLLGATPDTVFSAYYQSVLTGLQWSEELASPLLQALKTASPDRLSIKMVVDYFHDDSTTSVFTLGRVAGTIGPALAGEPANALAGGRLLRPLDQQVNFGLARIDAERSVAVFDFGNSFPTMMPAADAPNGPGLPFPNPQPADLGTLQAAIVANGEPVILGTIDNSAAAYQATASIQEFPLTADQLALAQKNPLVVIQDSSSGLLALLAEDQNATYLTVEPRVHRLEPGASAGSDLLALSFGVPAAGQTISLALDNNILQQQPGFPVGTPTDAIQFPASVTTDQDGKASFTINASEAGPGNPRGPIDGQLYGIALAWELDTNPDPNMAVSVHIYDQVTQPASPTWWQDVEPILRPYDDLYPFMANLVDLDDFSAVEAAAKEIDFRMRLPETDPRYMPVTRDLSDGKKQIVLTWIANGMPQGTKPSS